MTIWIIPVEPHEQRYTGEWHRHLPAQIEDYARSVGSNELVRVVDGGTTSGTTTSGAFLNFAETNVFKARQIATIADLFSRGAVQAGDRFLFADAWHYGAIAVRYMSGLLCVPVRQFGLFHAGAYDPHDFLGRLDNKGWALAFEQALFEAYDASCFATELHIDLFRRTFSVGEDSRILRCGWPMEYLREMLLPYGGQPKRNLVLFPHRLAPEKQVEIFRDLASEFPDYEFMVCQDERLTKAEYHRLLGAARIVFSASLQETLGIGCYEGLRCGALPFAPDRLSYREMYSPPCLYPGEWTESWEAYQRHKSELVARLRNALDFQAANSSQLAMMADTVGTRFFDGKTLYEALFAPTEGLEQRPALLPLRRCRVQRLHRPFRLARAFSSRVVVP